MPLLWVAQKNACPKAAAFSIKIWKKSTEDIIAEFVEEYARMKNFQEKAIKITYAKNALESQRPKLMK